MNPELHLALREDSFNNFCYEDNKEESKKNISNLSIKYFND